MDISFFFLLTLFTLALILNPYRLDVCVPLPSGVSVRVGYVVAGNLSLPANLTLSRHLVHLLVSSKAYACFLLICRLSTSARARTLGIISQRTHGIQVFLLHLNSQSLRQDPDIRLPGFLDRTYLKIVLLAFFQLLDRTLRLRSTFYGLRLRSGHILLQ